MHVQAGPGAANATLEGMTRTQTTLALLLALSGALYACGSAGLSGFGDPTSTGGGGSEKGSDAGFGGATAAPMAGADNGLVPVDNAVILVHAAKSQSFRLCFENESDRRPQPDSDVMPQANVVGVEVGAAVRLGPLRGAPGMVFLFEEPLIRAFYPAFGGAGQGPTCKNLLENMNLQTLAQPLGRIDTDLSHGVHLLAVRGCSSDKLGLLKRTVAECGADWTAAAGNLSVKDITLSGAKRPSPGVLPAQVVNLSQPVEGARGMRPLTIGFGDLVTPGASQATVALNPVVFGSAQPPEPASLTYDATDTAIYASVGFRVSLGPGAAPDGGTTTTLLEESLARIQKLSSPRDVPPTYYAAASNYALLLLGDPNAKLPDGGVDSDDRRNLHFLAVPVIEPKTDNDGGDGAGTGTGSSGGAVDGGSASTTP
jgi:hypothetical protein